MTSILELPSSASASPFLVGTAQQMYYTASVGSGVTLLYSFISSLAVTTNNTATTSTSPTPTIVLSFPTMNMLRTRAVSLFHAGGLTTQTPAANRCHHCDQVLASGWNHVALLTRVQTTTGTSSGSASSTQKFDRNWFSSNLVQAWGDDSYKQTTIPKFANTNADQAALVRNVGFISPHSIRLTIL